MAMMRELELDPKQRPQARVDNGGGGAWEYLCLVRKLKVRRSEKVLKYGLSILNDPKKRSALGPEEWTLYEQVAIAAMDCQCLDFAKDCIKVLHKKFPESKRVGRLDCMLLEAKGSWAEAEKAYSSLLEDNPLDQVLYTLGGLENLQTAKKYYASTIDLTRGKNTRALLGICLCTSAIAQLSKGRSKEDKESPELQSLAAKVLEKEYKQRAADKLGLYTAIKTRLIYDIKFHPP
ncbi:hypothetical protein GOBAR_AA29110 [Gossypium barbadense]|uniref:ER membrane protein complex subunit 2 n=1 Tax=Gossypium barbadense TaxID=3634 RepID=A0A2P5WKH0_GOSBA|nr:hypothetical protein GOBAR_AA29110 [Gossypium barbadense]